VKVDRATIVICTFNRAALLRETIDALARMTLPRDCEVELLIVDNNSSDETASAVAAACAAAPFAIRYAREPRQGKSFALNRALALARGDVIALTDDDVWPAPDWLSRIVGRFRSDDVMFVFGKVLPRWGTLPPAELLTARAQDIWGPLALVDYGDAVADYTNETAGGKRLPIGANLALRRDVLVAMGGWRTDLGKVDNTLISGEDHEIFLRLQRARLFRGVYDPAITVLHFVPPSRLTRRYFRRWFYWHGKTMHLMKAQMYQSLNMASVPHVAGVPRFVYRQAIEQLGRYVRKLFRRDALGLLTAELAVLEYLGFVLHGWKTTLRPTVPAPPDGDRAERTGAQWARPFLSSSVRSTAPRP
jgi:glycosyltransferase involved in cell wall biosynthesis